MRSLKKIAVTSLLSVSMLAATNLVSYNQSDHSVQIGYQRVFADEMPDDMKTALQAIANSDPDRPPALGTKEREAMKAFVENPGKYITAQTGEEVLNLIDLALDKPFNLARASSHERDKDTILGNVRNALSKAKEAHGTSTTGVDGRTDDRKRDSSDLTAGETYSTLYASVIYSLSKGESADSASISLNQLAKYPAQDGGGQNQQYGSLATPSLTTPKNPIGSQLAAYIQTLHDYNYLVMKDKTGFSGIWNTLTGWASNAVRGALLSTAMLGAMIYDFSFMMMQWLSDAFTKFNILKVTGITAGAEAANTFIEKLLSGVLNVFGLTGDAIRYIQYTIYIILLAMFVLKVITQLNKAKAKQAVKTTKLTTLRVFTIIMTIPVMAMMYSVSSTIFESLKSTAEDASRISDSYVLNVTKWAGTLNLSLDPMGASAVSSSNDGVKADKKFEPTPSNIAKLNRAIRAIDDSNNEKSGEKKRSAQLAMTAISNLMSDKEESVQGYFNYIAANGQSGSNMAAESMPTTSASDSSTGRSNAYLYVSRDKKEDALDKLKAILGLDDKQGGETNDEVGKSYSYDVNGKTIAITPASKADLVPVSWNNPTSYLYGAVPPGNLTTSTLNHANYHLSAYTNMLNDPKTDEVASDKELKGALVKNAQNFALINKYAGIKNYGGNNPALSSQSVAFLLQSKVSNGSINYKGYNTAANQAGSSKNTGAYGITYVENVVPSNGVLDYMGKIASLNAIWVAAGYTAFIVMLTLLKAPILGAIIRHLKGFFQALFVGDIIGLLESITFYLALSSSFVFGYLGILFGTSLVQQLIGEGAVASAVSFLTLIPTFGPIFISWLIAFILTWPVVSLSLGRSGKRRKVGVIEVIVAMPYLIAESLDPAFDRMYSRLYGKSRSQTLGAKIANKAQVIDQGAMLKDNLKKGANLALTAAQAAGSAVPGYGTAAAAAAGMMKGVLNGKGGMDGDPNDPNAIVPSTGNGFIDGAVRLGLGLAKDKLGDGKNKPLDAERDADLIEYDEFGNPINVDPETGLPIKGNDPSREHYGDLSSTGNKDEIDGVIPVDSQTPQEQAIDDSQAKLDEIAKNTQGLKDKDGETVVGQFDPNDPNAPKEPLEVEDTELKVAEIKETEIDQLKDPELQVPDIDKVEADDVTIENADALKDVDLHNTDDLKDVELQHTGDLKDVDLHNTDDLKDVELRNADDLKDVDVNIDDPKIETPNIDPLNVNNPDLHIDDPKIETPNIDAVDVNDPKIDIPNINPLDVNNPDLHIDDPKIETPNIDPLNVNNPDLHIDDPKIEAPEIKPVDVNDPTITAPEIKPLEVNNPDLHVEDTKINIPDIKPVDVNDPTIVAPEMKAPEMKVNDPKVEIPEVKAPEMQAPEIKTAEVKTPNFEQKVDVTTEAPKFEMPEQPQPTIVNQMNPGQPEIKIPEQPTQVAQPEVKIPEQPQPTIVNQMNPSQPAQPVQAEVKIPEQPQPTIINQMNPEQPTQTVQNVQAEVKAPEQPQPTVFVNPMTAGQPTQPAQPEFTIPNQPQPQQTVVMPTQPVQSQEPHTVVNNHTVNQTGTTPQTPPVTPNQSTGQQEVKVNLAGFSHQGKDFQFDPTKVQIEQPDRTPDKFNGGFIHNMTNAAKDGANVTKQTAHTVIDNASATVIGQTIASAVAPIGDRIKSAQTGKPVETVRQERIIEKAAKQEARETQAARDSVEKQITKEILIKENMSRGMSESQAKAFASLQQDVGEIASSPLGKLAHAAAKPLAFVTDRTLFGDKNVAQNAIHGKAPEGGDAVVDPHGYEGRSYQDRRNEERMMDTLDRIANSIENDRHDR